MNFSGELGALSRKIFVSLGRKLTQILYFMKLTNTHRLILEMLLHHPEGIQREDINEVLKREGERVLDDRRRLYKYLDSFRKSLGLNIATVHLGACQRERCALYPHAAYPPHAEGAGAQRLRSDSCPCVGLRNLHAPLSRNDVEGC